MKSQRSGGGAEGKSAPRSSLQVLRIIFESFGSNPTFIPGSHSPTACLRFASLINVAQAGRLFSRPNFFNGRDAFHRVPIQWSNQGRRGSRPSQQKEGNMNYNILAVITLLLGVPGFVRLRNGKPGSPAPNTEEGGAS